MTEAEKLDEQTRGPILIEQDCEADGDDLGALASSWWAPGHGHDPVTFIRAVVAYSLDEHESTPRIDADDVPAELWQWRRDHGDWIEYVRSPEQPTGVPRGQVQPITLLDLTRRTAGAPKCSITGCGQPWGQRPAVHVAVEPAEPGPGRGMTAEIYLCRRHGAQLPKPLYRLHLVPVGATILLPTAERAR